MKQDELISIIIPVYNSAKYLPDTIKSLQEQTYTNFEAIFVDDASSDDSCEVIEKAAKADSRLRLIKLEENRGAANARNVGLENAKSNYIAFLDADDLWNREKLEKQIAFMKEKNCGFSFTGYQFIDENMENPGAIVNVPNVMSYEDSLKNTTIFITTVMLNLVKLTEMWDCTWEKTIGFMKQSNVDSCGYDKTTDSTVQSSIVDCNSNIKKISLFRANAAREDTQAWWDILKTGAIAYGLDENLAYYRRYNSSSSANKLKMVYGTWRMYRDIEKLSVGKTISCFVPYVFNAVKRRM